MPIPPHLGVSVEDRTEIAKLKLAMLRVGLQTSALDVVENLIRRDERRRVFIEARGIAREIFLNGRKLEDMIVKLESL